MQKISVITLSQVRPLTTKGFPQMMSSRSVQPQQFVHVFGDDIFEKIRHQYNIFRILRSQRSSNVSIVSGGLSVLFEIPIPFVNLGSCYDGFTVHLT
ncbi:hypothetical protein TNCV_4626511 [Trichonephila clavipes]|nr:hypothetical protein TNCV_4626511 [Trichonephila clavipes]